MTWGPLSLLVALPIAGAASVALLDGERPRTVHRAGVAAAGVTFLLAAWIWAAFRPGITGLQFEERLPWVPDVGLTYHVGVDGLSVSLVALTAFLFPLALWAAGGQIRDRMKAFVVTALLLEAGLLGTFVAQDLVLFYVFWEGMLIPMYFLIALWGGPARTAAAIKFFLYTMAGSVLMLLAMLAVYFQGGRVLGAPTFDLPALLARPLRWSPGTEALLFGAFAAAFAIKLPVWPLHTWLPDAYAEAPPVVTVLLAGLMAKAGAYGLLRFCLPLFPRAAQEFGPLLAGLAVVGILYGGACAWAQGDLRRLLAYGSMSHMGFILLGIFALNLTAIQGSLIQMVNHGVSTGALFFLAGFLIARTGRARTEEYGGVAALAPALSAATLIVTVSSLALPGTNGFVGEFLILLGAFQANPVAGVLGAFGIVVAAAYLLAFVGRVFHGPARDDLRGLVDLRAGEVAVLVPLVAAIFAVGLVPGPLLDRSQATVRDLVRQVAAAAAARPAAAIPATAAAARRTAAVRAAPRAPGAGAPRPGSHGARP